MSFILIEGDNGTGKDTLASTMKLHGFSIVSYDNELKKLEIAAKGMKGNSRIEAFLAYNKACGNSVMGHKKACLVRYWISTLSAAYADKIIDRDDVLSKAIELVETMPSPDVVVRLTCPFLERIERIKNRNSEHSTLFDNVSIERSVRYDDISNDLFSISRYKTFEFDTSSYSPNKIAESIVTHVN